jgi:hypothetical protein
MWQQWKLVGGSTIFSCGLWVSSDSLPAGGPCLIQTVWHSQSKKSAGCIRPSVRRVVVVWRVVEETEGRWSESPGILQLVLPHLSILQLVLPYLSRQPWPPSPHRPCARFRSAASLLGTTQAIYIQRLFLAPMAMWPQRGRPGEGMRRNGDGATPPIL